jgi:hypothetical protein
VFNSFFLGGFECATGYNAHGERIDQLAATQHDRLADEDYRLLRRAGIRAARDGIRWPLVDRRGRYDFSSLRPLLEAARTHEVEVIWDLFHYGYPDDTDPFSPGFAQRFADYCYAAARYVAGHTDGACYFTPVNEPSYFAWAGGDAALFAPHAGGRSWELKVSLVRAAIQGIEAIWAGCPGARIVSADPLCRVVPPWEKPELRDEARHFNRHVVFQSWDMLCGRLLPELGGSRRHLDIMGINYYWTNQWELTRTGIPLHDDDPRRAPLRDLVRGVWERYGGDLLITETAHVGKMRPVWMRELAGECEALLDEGIPLRGVCLYPVLGMPEWHAQDDWTRMGLWDLVPDSSTLKRVPYRPAFKALREGQRLEGRQWAAPAETELAWAA